MDPRVEYNTENSYTVNTNITTPRLTSTMRSQGIDTGRVNPLPRKTPLEILGPSSKNSKCKNRLRACERVSIILRLRGMGRDTMRANLEAGRAIIPCGSSSGFPWD